MVQLTDTRLPHTGGFGRTDGRVDSLVASRRWRCRRASSCRLSAGHRAAAVPRSSRCGRTPTHPPSQPHPPTHSAHGCQLGWCAGFVQHGQDMASNLHCSAALLCVAAPSLVSDQPGQFGSASVEPLAWPATKTDLCSRVLPRAVLIRHSADTVQILHMAYQYCESYSDGRASDQDTASPPTLPACRGNPSITGLSSHGSCACACAWVSHTTCRKLRSTRWAVTGSSLSWSWQWTKLSR